MDKFLKVLILTGTSLLAFFSRLFSIVRYESIIHEYDPWFNYRSTQYMQQNGMYAFWNWFDSESWHPLGRVVSATCFPGLMFTAYGIKNLLSMLGFPNVDIRDISVMMAPIFSIFLAYSAYALGKEMSGQVTVGLVASLLIAVLPTIISRGVAGSFDNESIAIWAMLNTFYLWVKAINTGSTSVSVALALNYFYMVASWGGYSYIINLIPLFVLCCIFIDKFTTKMYVAYSIFYTVGTILSMQVVFVQPQVIRSSEHLISHLTFFAMNAFVIVKFAISELPKSTVNFLFKILMLLVPLGMIGLFMYLTLTGSTRFSGRTLSLLMPSYASTYAPLVASISEHSPSTYTQFFSYFHHCMILVPVGLYAIMASKNLRYGEVFIALYLLTSIYFAQAMNRLQLVAGPAVVLVAAKGAGIILSSQQSHWKFSIVIKGMVTFILGSFVLHSTREASRMSSPTVILSFGNVADGTRRIIDDYREAYSWLRDNTAKDAKILSWWDYGYQLTGMSNRTVIVDNNTWNNTHIATVGKVFALPEEQSIEIINSLDADYVLLTFGGALGLTSDDVSKFPWFVNIAANEYPGELQLMSYYKDGRIGPSWEHSSDNYRNSLLYRLAYYRFGEHQIRQDVSPGYDLAREEFVGFTQYDLRHFEEAYTSENWLVRIFKVKSEINRSPKFIDIPPRIYFIQDEPEFSLEQRQESGNYFRPLI